MTDREKQMIEAYIPSPRDPDLAFDEYYVCDKADRVRKVRIVSFLPYGDEMTYGVVETSTGRKVDAGYDSCFVGFRNSQLYDNKDDCRHQTHLLYAGWEYLRKLQETEAHQ